MMVGCARMQGSRPLTPVQSLKGGFGGFFFFFFFFFAGQSLSGSHSPVLGVRLMIEHWQLHVRPVKLGLADLMQG